MKNNKNITELARRAGISKSMVSQIIRGQRKAGWRSAKRLAVATGTDPVLWLEGSLDEIKTAVLQEMAVLTK